MEESRARSVRTWATVGLLAIAAVSFVASYVVPAVRGGNSPALTDLVLAAVLLLAILLGLVTFPTKQVSVYLAKRSLRKSVPAPADISRDLLAHLKTARRIWEVGGPHQYSDSFEYCAEAVLNRLPTDSRIVGDDRKQIFREQAYSLLTGWRIAGELQEHLLSEVDGLVQEYAPKLDTNTVVALLFDLYTLALSGTKLANQFVQSVANAGPDALDKSTRDQWREFADKANRLGQDITTLGDKVNTVTRANDSFYLPQVKHL
ncbi:MAG: hypothetical protein L3K18_08720 [Thermoplasmata archaeon]|nr:hypothetical protein [Thermoplasmata archaeon]